MIIGTERAAGITPLKMNRYIMTIIHSFVWLTTYPDLEKLLHSGAVILL
jgi:hypothetical protein